MFEVPGLEEIEIVAKREAILERLADDRLHKPALVEALDQSRSTVDRAIRELEEGGFVARTRKGHETTLVGRLALERVRQFRAEQVTIHEASDVLTTLPPEPKLPFSLCERGRLEGFDSAYRLFDHLAADLRSATRYRAVLPTLVDSRQLRLCHALAADGELDVELLVGRDRLHSLGREYPTLCAELIDAGALRALDQPPSFALSLVGGLEGEETTRVRVVSHGGESVDVLSATDVETVEWMHDTYESYRAESHADPGPVDRTDPIERLSLPDEAGLPLSLRSEGFVRLDDEYVERHDPMNPTTAWRAGLGLPEVQAGYALPRRTTDDATDADWLAGQLIEQLRSSSTVALIGPPGCGKSTVCKRVACDWNEHTGGTALYRESGRSEPFSSTATLQQIVERERQSGPVLVVVEDAVREEANEIFRFVQRVQGIEDVAVLLDARESEWTDPDEFPIDARLEAVRQESVRVAHVPELERAECERLIERVETTAGRELSVTPAQILDDIRETARETIADEGRARAGTLFLLFQRLARTIDPLSADDGDDRHGRARRACRYPTDRTRGDGTRGRDARERL